VSPPPAVRVRQAYEAFERADVAAVRDALAPDVVIHVAGRGPMAGDHKGVDAVFDLVVRSIDATGGTMHLRVGDVVADEHLAVALVDHELLRGDSWIRFAAVHVWHLGPDGRAVRCDVTFDDAYAVDELFGALVSGH
jgi:ketosteroid isomerase-like protein